MIWIKHCGFPPTNFNIPSVTNMFLGALVSNGEVGSISPKLLQIKNIFSINFTFGQSFTTRYVNATETEQSRLYLNVPGQDKIKFEDAFL